MKISALLKSPALSHFSECVKSCPSLLIEGLSEGAKAALIALATGKAPGRVLILTAGMREERLLENLPFFGVDEVLELPAWETLPEEGIAPSIDIVGKRLDVLYKLADGQGKVVVCPLQAVLQKTLSKELLTSLCMHLRVKEQVFFDTLPDKLSSIGYRRACVAADKGEFAVRGGIIDIFPISSPDPFRIEFIGDEIDTIRTYDPIGQKSIARTSSCFISPASEQGLVSVWEYLGKDVLVIVDDLLDLEDKYVALQKIAPAGPSPIFSFQGLIEKIIKGKHILFTKEPAEELSPVSIGKKKGRGFYSGKEPLQPLTFEVGLVPVETQRWHHPFVNIEDFFPGPPLETLSSMDCLPLQLHFVYATALEKKILDTRLKEENVHLPENTHYEEGYLSHGFVIEDSLTIFFPMTELTHRLRTRRQKWRSSHHTGTETFHELQSGDMAVHFQHGIGKYVGTEKKLNHLGQETEFLVLNYADGGTLYVPCSQAHLVSRYIGAHETAPPLSTLGTGKWLKTRTSAERSIAGYAQDLLKLHAERSLRGGFAYPEDSEEMLSFEEDFPFVPTEDQLIAVAAIKEDMMSDKAMDRLICGDVGYGKTEVAMRAAFKAVCDGKKQVAVLVPTTVLALQHYETFKERMANFPIRIAHLSRLSTSKQAKETLAEVAKGHVDILIGTHRLISKDVQFLDLGLIIVDEEQRFGVRAKEHLKSRKIGVDCLTLSATPIPRTLYLSVIGVREISVINTPPQDRLPIKTILAEKEMQLIKNGLVREFSRDGQVFFIHNRVETLPLIQEELQKCVPEARILSAHGQMPAEEIDQIFHLFKSGQADILLATTIVENGVDIPNANTIFIDRADQFGLAELYQLRGRVGRWNKPAYAYFLIPQGRRLAEPSQKRLEALLTTAGYGGGMKIALRDLEIRGSGDILGTQQSGQVSAIGFHLYCKLLKKATLALRHKAPPTYAETKIECSYPASLPESYINESGLRMEIYHRLGDSSTIEEVDDILSELKDRFGTPPPQALWLCHIARLRVFATAHRFSLLRFETYTFTAERLSSKQTFTLPRTTDPQKWEASVLDALTKML